jgi:hypothetical protein
VRLFARICYSIAAALGLLSLGVEWRTRQARAKRLSFLPTHPSYISLVVGLWAGVLTIVGKAAEEVGHEVGERRPLTITAKSESAAARFNAYRTPKQAQTLRSDYDLSDQYVEHPSDRHSLVGAH